MSTEPTIQSLIEEARQLVIWYKQPSGYQAADTEIGPKVDRAFKLLETFSEVNVLKERAQVAQLHIEIGHLKARLGETVAPALPPNRIELYGPCPVNIVIAVCDAVSKAKPDSMCDSDIAKQRGAVMVVTWEDPK